MIFEISDLSNGVIKLQDRCSSNVMDVRRDFNRDNRNIASSVRRPPPATVLGKSKPEFGRTLSSQSSSRRLIPASYFSLESLILLVGLTASLLILPLILPPLPPPPFMLLLVPIGILALLMVLAFMPTCNARNAAYTYM